MYFQHSNAYIGPFLTSYARGEAGDTQKYCFPIPVLSRAHVAQGFMVMDGEIRLNWSDQRFDTTMGIGGSFPEDSPGIPLAIDAEVTFTALRRSAYLCVSAVGIEQKVILDRFALREGERIMVERYALLAVAGEKANIRINQKELRAGIRLVYARDGELEIEALAPVHLGKFSFAG